MGSKSVVVEGLVLLVHILKMWFHLLLIIRYLLWRCKMSFITLKKITNLPVQWVELTSIWDRCTLAPSLVITGVPPSTVGMMKTPDLLLSLGSSVETTCWKVEPLCNPWKWTGDFHWHVQNPKINNYVCSCTHPLHLPSSFWTWLGIPIMVVLLFLFLFFSNLFTGYRGLNVEPMRGSAE